MVLDVRSTPDWDYRSLTLKRRNTQAEALSASTSSFVTSLAVNFAIAGGELVAFIFLRRWIKAM